MKPQKLFSYSDKNQIWRILISETDKLIVETRDIERKEVFFSCINLLDGKRIFKNLQLKEKFWIGIESVFRDIIYFHEYARPNIPQHKKIIAFDLNNQEVLWKNDDLTFLSVFGEKVFAFNKKFEGQNLYSLDYLTGVVLEDLGNNPTYMHKILNISGNIEDFSRYKYPEKIDRSNNPEIREIVEKEISGKFTLEEAYILEYQDLILFNYFLRRNNNLLDNKFAVYNIEKKKKVISETINRNLNSHSPDSFFCYKNFLILLKDKSVIDCYRLV